MLNAKGRNYAHFKTFISRPTGLWLNINERFGRRPGVLEAKRGSPMSRNTLYLIIGALIVIAVGFGIYVYQQETQRPGLEIQVNEQGISVEGN